MQKRLPNKQNGIRRTISKEKITYFRKKGKTYSQIAKRYGMTRQWIHQVHTDGQYRHIGKRINTKLVIGWSGFDEYIKQCQQSERNYERAKT